MVTPRQSNLKHYACPSSLSFTFAVFKRCSVGPFIVTCLFWSLYCLCRPRVPYGGLMDAAAPLMPLSRKQIAAAEAANSDVASMNSVTQRTRVAPSTTTNNNNPFGTDDVDNDDVDIPGVPPPSYSRFEWPREYLNIQHADHSTTTHGFK